MQTEKSGSVKDTDMDIVMWHRLLYPYEQAVDELMLKFNYMKKEYQVFGRYCPIEHVIGRVYQYSGQAAEKERSSGEGGAGN